MSTTKKPRAYDIGGFSVGAPVIRVEIVEQVGFDTYRVKTVSRKHTAYPYGEVRERKGYDLYDKYSIGQGPRCYFRGQEWKKRLPVQEFERPMFYLTR